MLSSSPRQFGLEIAATPEYLSVSKDANSLASFSTTGGSRGSSAVASYSELPEQQQGVTVERATVATNHDSFSHTIMVQSTPSVGLANNGSHAQLQQLDSRSLEGTVDADNADVVAQALLPTYAWQMAERKECSELKDDERGALEALDDYLASPQVTECSLPPNDGSRRTTGRCFTASSSSVTREELDRWVQEVHGQLHIVMDTMSAKLSQCRARIAEKDEVIKRLHWRLQNSEWSSSQSCGPALGSGGGTNPRTPQRRAVRSSVGGPCIGSGRGMDAPCSPTGVAALRGTRTSTEGATASSSTGTTAGRAGSPTSCGPQGRPLRAARENAQREGREQTREKGEPSQIAFLRQENAQMRRRNNELSAQVRQRETQMDGLTNMIKEMQVTAQRQSGLFKRQLHIRDDTLLQMQEELLATRGSTAIGTAPGSVSSTSTTGATKPSDLDVNTNRTTAQLREALGNGTVSGTGGAVSSSSSTRRAGVEIGVTNASLSKSVACTAQGQAPRAARRPVEGVCNASERGSSAARSLSAFGRNKERNATRRSGDRGEEQSLQTRQRIEPRIVGSMVQTLPTSTGGPPSTSSAGSSVFSPRGRPGKAVGIAQAAHNAVVQSTTHLAHQQSSSAEAPPASGSRGGPRGSFRGSGNGSIVSGPNSLVWSTGPGSQSSAMHRASSADARTRGSTRGVIVRRANRRQ